MDTQKVIVRDFQGRPLVRRVYGADAKKVYIILDTPNPRAPIGFPRNDVFFYDEKLLLELTQGLKSRPHLWTKLITWSENHQ